MGSLASGAVTLDIFARQTFGTDGSDRPTDSVVNGLLFAAALLPLFGSCVALYWGAEMFPESNPRPVVLKATESVLARRRLHAKQSGKYQQVGVVDGDHNEDGGLQGTNITSTLRQSPVITHDSTEVTKDDETSSAEIPTSPSQEEATLESSSDRFLRRLLDIAGLAIFQALLILAALRSLIVSSTSTGLWNAIVLTLVGVMVFVLAWSSQLSRRDRFAEPSRTVSPRRLGLYLILRHATPSSGYVMSSYFYALFESDLFFLQCLSVLGSAMTALASWTYGNCVAKRFSDGFGIIRVIAVTTIIGSLCSLLYLLIIQFPMGNISDGPNIGMYVLIASISALSSFVGELRFLPSVVIATTNIANASNNARQGVKNKDGLSDMEYHFATEADGESTELFLNDQAASSSTLKEEDGHVDTRSNSEGMQYASFISCINFGDQLASWTSVPILAAIGVKREDDWAGLDSYIIACATASVLSLIFLPLIRPPMTSQPPLRI